MKDINEIQKPCFTFIWRIENFSHCLQKKTESLRSPTFTVNTSKKTYWELWLYPRGKEDSIDGHVGFYLYNAKGIISAVTNIPENSVSSSPSTSESDNITAGYKLSFLSVEGRPEISKNIKNHGFTAETKFGFPSFVSRNEIIKENRSKFLPQDTLTVQCCLWIIGTYMLESELYFTRTVIGIERSYFFWPIKEFRNERRSAIDFVSKKTHLQTTKFLIDAGSYLEDNVQIKISQVDTNRLNFATLKISHIDSLGKGVTSAQDEHWFDIQKGEQIWSFFPPLVTKSRLASQKSVYLPNDVLFLRCEFIISFGVEINQIEGATHEVSPIENNMDKLIDVSNCLTKRNIEFIDGLKGDLRDLYVKGTFSDFNLLVGTETFPVHKSILGARSRVFEVMFTCEMKEKSSDFVEITDLEVETVENMISFLYTDTVENLTWESASKLYFAAEKYELLTLKLKCAASIKSNLCVSNACEVLNFADMYQDRDLKEAVQEFIFHHDEEIISSEEWNQFLIDNTQLAAETMQFMYRKKLEI